MFVPLFRELMGTISNSSEVLYFSLVASFVTCLVIVRLIFRFFD